MSIIDPDSPYRITPKGDYKKPAFVKFDPKDDAANLDEIFWEGERKGSILLEEVRHADLMFRLKIHIPSPLGGVGMDMSNIGDFIQFVSEDPTLCCATDSALSARRGYDYRSASYPDTDSQGALFPRVATICQSSCS